MKRQHIASMVIVSASIFVVGITLAAQDRFTLKSPNGIAFSEFKDYDAWQVIATSQPDDAGGCGSSPAPGCIKAIVGNPMMIKAYNDGIPANGKSVPDGAVMAKIEWRKKHIPAGPASAYGVTVPGTYSEVSFMVKDSKRFPNTNGWGYATFRYDAASDTFKAFGDSPAFANTCHACHTLVKARDFVFTNYPKR
ncbi:MAG: cytochrome P460 family protein [Gammaproteobacteria bacterium]